MRVSRVVLLHEATQGLRLLPFRGSTSTGGHRAFCWILLSPPTTPRHVCQVRNERGEEEP